MLEKELKLRRRNAVFIFIVMWNLKRLPISLGIVEEPILQTLFVSPVLPTIPKL